MKPYYQDEYVTIYHGDCRGLLVEIPDNSVDLVLTDPPYDIHAESCGFDGGRRFLDTIREKGLHESFDFNLLDEFITKLKELNVICFCNQAQLLPYLEWNRKINKNFRLLSWHKPGCIPLRHHYRQDTEFILHFWDNQPIRGGYKPTYFIHKVNRNGFKHPTVKPESIVSKLILGTTDRGHVVLDPFLGSGTTALCAKKLGRQCIGFEIQEQYAEMAALRCSQTVMQLVTNNGHRCYVCSSPISGKRADSYYCSNRCRQLSYRNRRNESVTDKEVVLV